MNIAGKSEEGVVPDEFQESGKKSLQLTPGGDRYIRGCHGARRGSGSRKIGGPDVFVEESKRNHLLY